MVFTEEQRQVKEPMNGEPYTFQPQVVFFENHLQVRNFIAFDLSRSSTTLLANPLFGSPRMFCNINPDTAKVLASSDHEDDDAKSDAGMRDGDCWESKSETELEEDYDSAFYGNSVKKKLEVLAAMVGIQCEDPGSVLAEVVKVLKELQRKMEFVSKF